MLIDPQHEGARGLDSETWESSNASVARDHSPEVGIAPGIELSSFRSMISVNIGVSQDQSMRFIPGLIDRVLCLVVDV